MRIKEYDPHKIESGEVDKEKQGERKLKIRQLKLIQICQKLQYMYMKKLTYLKSATTKLIVYSQNYVINLYVFYKRQKNLRIYKNEK